MKPDHLLILSECAKEAKFGQGEVLFREGEPAERLFLIESGRVAVEAQQGHGVAALVQHLGHGEVLGWSWLFPPYGWQYDARALEPTTAIVINGAHLLVAAERNHDFGYELMKRVAQVVIRRLQATRRRLPSGRTEATPES